MLLPQKMLTSRVFFDLQGKAPKATVQGGKVAAEGIFSGTILQVCYPSFILVIG